MILLISYDLKTPNANYDALYDLLKSAPSWWHYLNSTWLIYTPENVDVWQKKIRVAINSNDSFIVIDITRQNRNGWLPQKAWDWIKEYEKR